MNMTSEQNQTSKMNVFDGSIDGFEVEYFRNYLLHNVSFHANLDKSKQSNFTFDIWRNFDFVPQNETIIEITPRDKHITDEDLKSRKYKLSGYGIRTQYIESRGVNLNIYGSENGNFDLDQDSITYRKICMLMIPGKQNKKGHVFTYAGKHIHYIGFKLDDNKIILRSIYEFPELLIFAGTNSIDNKIIVSKLQSNENYMKKIPRIRQTVEICLEFTKNNHELCNLTHYETEHNLHMESVRQNYKNIGKIMHPSIEICKFAIGKNVKAFSYIKTTTLKLFSYHMKKWGFKGLKIGGRS
jgi:hypothetical protein